MDSIQSIMRECFTVPGAPEPVIRSFIIDYHDEKGNSSYNSIFTAGEIDLNDKEFLTELAAPYIVQGYTIDALHEVLHGYTHEDIEAMAKASVTEARKHFRPILINWEALS